MGCEDDEDEAVVIQIYEAMVRANKSEPTLNSFEQGLVNRHVRRDVRLRCFAGEVLLEMIRIAQATRQPPSQAQAVRLAAHNHYQAFRRSSPKGLEREVRRGFSKFRNTAHLQAAMVLAEPSVVEMENDEPATGRFLARARGFELFVDRNVAGAHLKWNPWRIPPCVHPTTAITLTPLTQDERIIIQSG
jgi:hypothetical protein